LAESHNKDCSILSHYFIYIFLSSEQRRLRAGWRILAQLLLLKILTVICKLVLFPLLNLFNLTDDVKLLSTQTISLIAITLSVFLARRYLDRRTFASLGLNFNQHTLPDLLFGFVVSGSLIASIYTIEWVAGWLDFSGFAWQELPLLTVLFRTLIGLLAFGITASWNEELRYRGYLLQNLKDGINLRWAILLSSTGFAVYHLRNPDASWSSTLGIFLGGLFLAYGWVCTRQLWLSMGLHTGWNFFEGVVFGFPVSGFNSFHLVRQTVSGPEWITGGAFGPEGGLIMALAMLSGITVIHWWRRG
jgi:membrane protease YdiL (CAAX protease family)